MDFSDSFVIKELYDVSLKATLNIEIGEKTFLPGETILHFDELQLSNLTDQSNYHTATGGAYNSVLISWDTTKAVDLICQKGVVSRTGLAILLNSKLSTDTISISVPYTDIQTTDITGKLVTKYLPSSEFFIYNEEGSTPIGFTTNLKTITGLQPSTIYTMQYNFTYTEGAQVISMGSRLLNGYLKLTAKMRLKDDSDGHTTTGLLEIPRVRLVSDLSMRLGSHATPDVSNFRLQGDPVGERNNAYVCKLTFLDTDIDSIT